MIPLITLEEHFFSSVVDESEYAEQMKWLEGLLDKLKDLGPIRLEYMDKGAVSLQVISHAPGLSGKLIAECAAANDQLAGAVSKNPTRFAGFAVLPMSDPENAAKELRRSVKELGLVGALVDEHVDGVQYEGKKFWPIYETAQDLDVPIYLHPTWPSSQMATRFEGEYDLGAEMSIGTSGWGWHSSTGLHILKLFSAGVFDAYPKLKIIVGHFGEMLPFMLERIELLSIRWGEQKRKFRQVYEENLWVTTSGVWAVSPMACILRNTPIDHILYSVDYPFAKNEDGLKFMEDLEKSGLVTQEQFEAIGYKNAEKLLRIKVQQ